MASSVKIGIIYQTHIVTLTLFFAFSKTGKFRSLSKLMHHDEMMPPCCGGHYTKTFYDGYYHNKLANDYHNFSLIVEGK